MNIHTCDCEDCYIKRRLLTEVETRAATGYDGATGQRDGTLYKKMSADLDFLLKLINDTR